MRCVIVWVGAFEIPAHDHERDPVYAHHRLPVAENPEQFLAFYHGLELFLPLAAR